MCLIEQSHQFNARLRLVDPSWVFYKARETRRHP
jgi:hypothetical protein